MSDVVLSIRTDKTTKRQLTDFADSLGLTTSALATVVLKQALRERRVVLEAPLEPTPALVKTMRRAETDLKLGRNVTPGMSKDQAIDYLKSL